MNKPTMIVCAGPEPYIDRISGDELPEWFVFQANDDREPTGKVYTVRKSFHEATRLATNMSIDRRLQLVIDAVEA